MRPLFHASPDERRRRQRAPVVAGVVLVALAALAAAFVVPQTRDHAIATTQAAQGRLMHLLDVQATQPPAADPTVPEARPGVPGAQGDATPPNAPPGGEEIGKRASVPVLVASPDLKHPLFSNAVIYIAPLPSGGHLGIILNRPTHAKLGEMFPDHEPSQRVAEPVFFGGPVQSQVIVAIMQADQRPSEAALPIAQRTYIAFDAPTIDDAIEKNPAHSRFYAGFVVWGPNQLEQQVSQGAWKLKQVDAKEIIKHEPESLWRELSGPSKGAQAVVWTGR